MTAPLSMSRHELDDSDIEAVLEVLRSDRLALGPRIEDFERAMADYVGTRHALAVSSGTAALHLIVRSLGLGPGDEVLVPSFTFVASVNAILYEKATPVFVEIEPDTCNISPDDLRSRITSRTRAIMVVDVFGHPAEWDSILRIAHDHDLLVIDDSCEALGAQYRGVKLGRFGDAAAFAFYPNKQITTGEGGMLVTDDDDIARIARSLRNQGRGAMGTWLVHERLGFNYRLDEMSAALGISQLTRLEQFMAKRERVANMYNERLAACQWLRVPVVREHVRMSWFVYVIILAEGLDRAPVVEHLQRRGIPVRGYFPPAHLQPYIRELFGTAEGELPVTESTSKRTVALPFHNKLTEEQIERVVQALQEAAP